VPPAWDNHICVTLARLDELAVHRLNGREVLFDNLVERPAANPGVPLDATDEPDVRIRVHEHLNVTELTHSGVDEEENAVDDDYIRWFHPRAIGAAKMGDEIVLGLLDRLSFAQRFEVRAQQVVVESVRMVPVEFLPLVERKGGEVLVVCVHIDERNGRCRQKLGDIHGHGRLARSRAAGNSDYQGFHHRDPKLRFRCMECIMPRRHETRTLRTAELP